MFRWHKLIPKGVAIEVQVSGPKKSWSEVKWSYKARGMKVIRIGKYWIIFGHRRISQK